MGRSPLSFALLRRRLDDMGHITSSFGYSVSTDSLESIANKWVAHIAREVSPNERYAVIGHSLGGIITRLAFPRLPPGLSKFVMLAPPNRSPAAAQQLKHNRLFRLLTGDAGQKLGDVNFYATLPVPTVPTLVFAGTLAAGSLFHRGGEVGDAVLSADETHLAGARHLEVRAIHTFIMNNNDVTREIGEFLRQ